MIAANQWYNIAETDTIGTRTGIRIDFGTKYALFTVSVDYGNSVISAVESNISKEETKLSVRIRQNNNAWYVDVRMSVAQDTTLKAALYENTGGWEAVAPNTSVVGNTICIINDLTSHITPSGGGESLFERINVGTAENPLYAVVPKKYNGVDVGIISNTFMSMAGFGLPDDVPAVAPTLSDLNDVQITEPAAGDVLTYNDALGTWVNGPGGLNEEALSKYLQDKKYITDTLLNNTLKAYLTVEVYNAGVKEINKKITAVEERIKWFYYDEENNAIHTSCNFISDGTMSMAGVGSSNVTPAVPNITIMLGEVPYDSVNGVVSLPAYPSVGLDEKALESYLTTNQYAKKSDIPSLEGYARASDLNTLRTDFDNLNNLLNTDVSGVINTWSEVVDFLDEYSGSQDLATILAGMNNDIANRVLYTDFEKLEDSVSGIAGYFTNGSANNALKLGGQLPSYYATVDALNLVKKDVTAVSNRVQKFEDVIGIDANGDVYIKGTRNFYTEGGTIGMAGLGSGGGTGGGGTAGLGAVTVRVNGSDYITDASGIVTIPDYPTSLPASDVYAWAKAATKPSYSFSEIGGKPTTAAGYGIVDALTFTNNGAYVGANMPSSDLSKLAASAYIELWDSAGWWNLKAAKYIVPGGTSSHFLKGDGSLDATAYLPLSGGTIIGDLYLDYSLEKYSRIYFIDRRIGSGGYADEILVIRNGASVNQGAIGLYGNANGVSYYYFGHNAYNGNNLRIYSDKVSFGDSTLYHTGNFNPADYLPLSGGTISSGAFSPLTIKGNSSYAGIGFQKTGDSAPSYLVYINEWDWRITNANWADSKKILHSGNYSSYALPLSGGTISASGWNKQLSINRDGTSGSVIVGFYLNNTFQGGLGFNAANSPIYSNTNGEPRVILTQDNYSSYALPLSGGTITSTSLAPLMLTSTASAGHSILQFSSASTYLGALGFKGVNEPYFRTIEGAFNALIHSGNIGSQSVDAATRLVRVGSITDANTITFTDYSLRWYSAIANTATNLPSFSGYQNGLLALPLHSSGTTAQIYMTAGNSLYFRGNTGADWKTIAFTDSNVASATKLQTARTIWGQSFNGSANVSGNLHLGTSALYWNSDSANYSIQIKDDGKAYYKAYYGHYFYSSATERMRITSGGNVLIGTTTDSGYKLDVAGTVSIGTSSACVFNMSRTSLNYFTTPANGYFGFVTNGKTTSMANSDLVIQPSFVTPGATNIVSLGSDNYRWKVIYGNQMNLSSHASIGGNLTVAGGLSLTDVTGSSATSNKLKFIRNTVSDDYWDYGLYAQSTKGLTFFQSSMGVDTDIAYLTGNGDLVVTGDIISEGTIAMAKLASSSDRKLKDNIAEVSAEQSMSIIRQLRPTTWDWKKDGKKSYGLIAQEVAPIVPEMVVDMGHLHLEYNQLHAFEIGAIKHIDSEVDILKRELKKTQKQLKAATKKIGALELQLNDYRRAAICQ